MTRERSKVRGCSGALRGHPREVEARAQGTGLLADRQADGLMSLLPAPMLLTREEPLPSGGGRQGEPPLDSIWLQDTKRGFILGGSRGLGSPAGLCWTHAPRMVGTHPYRLHCKSPQRPEPSRGMASACTGAGMGSCPPQG